MPYQANVSKVCFLQLMWHFRRDIRLFIEQPSGSFMFKMPKMKNIISMWSLAKHTTHLGLFGHDLMKCTHILGNWRGLCSIERTATKQAKQKHALRIQTKQERLRAKGKQPKIYYVKLGGGKWQGGPSLAESAVYPAAFVRAVVKAWMESD